MDKLSKLRARISDLAKEEVADAIKFRAEALAHARRGDWHPLALYLRGRGAVTREVRSLMSEILLGKHRPKGKVSKYATEREHIKNIIGIKANTPEAANNLLKVLRVLLWYAVDIGMIHSNPAMGIKKYRSRGEGIHTWSEVEVAQFEARHQIGTKARLALALMLYTGQRKGDAVRMGWQHVRGDLIAVRQEKTDTPLLIPMHPELERTLAWVPRTNMTFLVTQRGAPFTPAGFGNWFRDRCDEAGLPQCSAHGLRHAAATRLANAGCSTNQIKAITGHKSLSSFGALHKNCRPAAARAGGPRDPIRGGTERVENFVQS
jgi:integrase